MNRLSYPRQERTAPLRARRQSVTGRVLEASLDLRGAPRLSVRARVSWGQTVGRVVLIWIVAYLALRTGHGVAGTALRATIVTALWTPFVQWAGRASRTMTFAMGTFAAAAAASLAGLAAVSALGFWLPRFGLTETPLAVIALATFALTALWDTFVRRAARAPHRVLVVGGGEATARLVDDLALDDGVDLEIVAVVDDTLDPDLRDRVPYGGSASGLASAVRRLSPDLVVVAVQHDRPVVFRQLLDVAESGFQVVGLPELYEFAFGRLPVRELTAAWFMSVLHLYNRPYGRAAKRSFDVAVAAVGLLAALPLLPLVVLLVRRTGGPVLYRQQRLGEHGRVFTMLKFRSMRVDAEERGAPQWARPDDPRVIPGGRFLRRSRLDELPQLWNVLRGDMSIVGPRPERPEFLEQLEAEVPYWSRRHLLKPGITGWAQIRSSYAADALGTEEKLSYDLWYLRHRSLALDLVICLKTIPGMASGRGAR